MNLCINIRNKGVLTILENNCICTLYFVKIINYQEPFKSDVLKCLITNMFEKWSKLCSKIGQLNDYTNTATCVLNIFLVCFTTKRTSNKNTHIYIIYSTKRKHTLLYFDFLIYWIRILNYISNIFHSLHHLSGLQYVWLSYRY